MRRRAWGNKENDKKVEEVKVNVEWVQERE